MSKTIEEILRNSIGKKKALKIRYYGGSQPGTVREISVNEVDPPYVLAYCHGEEMEKRYFIDKIEIIDKKESIDYKPFCNDYEFDIEDKCSECKCKLNLKIIVRQNNFGRIEVFVKRKKE